MKRHMLQQHDVDYDQQYQCCQVGAMGVFNMEKLSEGNVINVQFQDVQEEVWIGQHSIDIFVIVIQMLRL